MGALLRFADSSISDVVLDTAGDPHAHAPFVTFLHGERASEFSEEFDGAKAWFRLVGPVLTALVRGHVLVLDAVDISLRPLLPVELLKIFSDRLTNPRAAQLIFASHGTSLLHHVSRDEVWLTEKISQAQQTYVRWLCQSMEVSES